MKKWFDFKASTADPTVAEINIFGLIGDFIDDLFAFDAVTTAKSFVDELAKLPATVKTLRVRINSVGGDAMGGVTIANALRAEQAKGRTVETIVEGLAASAASIVAMGGNPVQIADNGLLMIHSPWSVSVGNAGEMRATADVLDKIRDALVTTYQWHSDLSDKEIIALIDGPDGQGTWMDADEAIAAGLADEKIEGLKAAASIDPRAAGKLMVPEKYVARVAALIGAEDRIPEPAPAPAPIPTPKTMDAVEVVRVCGEAGLDLAFAQALIAVVLDSDEVGARAEAEKTKRAEAKARETDVRALCAAAKQTDLADDLVASGMTIPAVKAHLTKITAKLDKVEIDAHLSPDHGTNRRPVIDVQAVYAKRNQLALTKGKE